MGIVYPSGFFQQVGSSTVNYSDNDIRGAISDGTNFWASGASVSNADGIDYYGPGTPAGLGTGANPPKAYGLRIFNGQIYYSTQKAGPTNTVNQLGIFSFGAGLPVNGNPAPTQLINTGTTVVEDFSIDPTTTICYIAVNLNSSIGGIQKWVKTSGTWNFAYTLKVGTNIGAYGLVVDYSAANPILYATTFEATGNRVVKIIDDGTFTGSGTTATGNAVASTLVPAVNNVFYKGISFAPVASGTPVVNLTVSSTSGTETDKTVITVTANASATVSGNQTVSLSVSGTGITNGDYTLSNTAITIPSGSTSGSVTFTIVDDSVTEAAIETALLTISNPSSGITLGNVTTQTIAISDNSINHAPTISINVSSTTNFIDGGVTVSPATPFTLSGVKDDATDPASVSGIDFTINDQETPVTSLTITAISSNLSVVPASGLILTGTNGLRNLKIVPSAVGYTTITVSVSDGIASTNYILKYAASSAAPVISSSTATFQTGISDASDAVAIDDDYYMTGDDELDVINVYSRSASGLPVKSFDYTTLLGLPDPGKPEVDVEAGTKSLKNTNTTYWLGSMSNGKAPFDNKPNRDRLFATTSSGTGAATTISAAGYSAIKTALLAWGDANGYAFTASAAAGVDSKSTAGFAAEGMVFAPDSTTLWIGLRAPLVPTVNRTKAVLAPILNFETWFNNGNQTGNPTFGAPIELDLNMKGIRDIIRLSNGSYVIIAGSSGDVSGTNEIYKWTGNPADAPISVSSAANGMINMEGTMEVHDGGNLSLNKLQIISDGGSADLYNDGKEAKDLGDLIQRKFRTDRLTDLDLAVVSCPQVTANITTTNDSFCPGDSTLLTAPDSVSSYTWSTGATTRSITVHQAGSYSVTINKHGCVATSPAKNISLHILPGDIDADGTVLISDLSSLLLKFGTHCTCPEDINGDHAVNVEDLGKLLLNFGLHCNLGINP